MIVSLHQPNYMPYPGYFNKIKHSDLFIIYDTAQYVKNRWDNRNRIRIKEGTSFLTIPVKSEDSYLKMFKDVKLPSDKSWQQKHWKTITGAYSRAKAFELYFAFFEKHYQTDFDLLIDFSEAIILYLMEVLGVSTKVIRASSLCPDTELKSTDAIIDIISKAGATEYLSGPSGRKYMDLHKFDEAGIKLSFQEYHCPEYLQRFEGFEPNLATIDLLFNTGEEARNYI